MSSPPQVSKILTGFWFFLSLSPDFPPSEAPFVNDLSLLSVPISNLKVLPVSDPLSWVEFKFQEKPMAEVSEGVQKV